jgi:hypothetical protein
VALAPADFYAYSRATGQPYPESPEERAMQAPQVLEFRRNQLKATESRDTNPVALGVGIALGLAGLGGAGLAARRMLRSGKATGQSGVSQVDLSDADFSNVRRAGAVNLKTTPTTVEPSKVATAPTRRDPFDLSSYAETSSASPQQTVDINAEVDAAVNRLLNDPGLLKYVEAEEAAEIMKQPAMRAEQARQQAQVRRARSAAADDILLEIRSEPINTLVSQQQETGVFNVRQAIAALESGEDQQTGRIKSQLQRNEDLNLNQIGALENITAQEPSLMVEQDSPINRVASQLPDGLPVDQAERKLIPGDEGYQDRLLKTIYQQELEARPRVLTKEDMERNIQTMRNNPRISVDQAERKLIPGDEGYQDRLLKTIYQQELEARPRVLTKEDMERNIQTMRNNPRISVDQRDVTPQLTSQQFADIAKDEMMARRQVLFESGLRGERLERALGREPSRAVVSALESVGPSDIDVAPLQERTLINIGPGAEIEKAASNTSIRGTSRIGATVLPQESSRQVGGPDYVLFEGRPVYTVNAPVEMAQDIPGVRRQVALPAERIDDYAIKSDLGGGIGIYGVEPAFAAGAVSKGAELFEVPRGRTPLGLSPGAIDPMISTTEAAGRTPSAVPKFTEKDNPFRAVSTGAVEEMAIAGTGSQALAAQRELNRRTRNPESVAVSEAMRRARIEGRDPQVFLDKLLRERGVSSVTGSFSPLR